MTRNGTVILLITVQPMTEEEMCDVETQKGMTDFDKSAERKINEDNPWYTIEIGAEPDRIILDDDMEDYLEEIWQPYKEEAVNSEAEDC
eukprot:9197940-Ditylum_brightwellii.AAC.1